MRRPLTAAVHHHRAPHGARAQTDGHGSISRAGLPRDHHCRGPGCTVPASACDFDHNTNHADGGPTTTSNGSAKHRRHHNLKTRRLWHTTQHPDGAITWTTLLGRTYTTTPHDYRELNQRDEIHDTADTAAGDTLPTPEDPPPS